MMKIRSGNGFVAFDDVRASVPDNLVQAIRRHVDEINARGGPKGQLAGLKPGDAVIIQGGPFEGHEAIFDARLPGRERVRVLMRLLQARQVNIELPAAQIKRLRQKGRRPGSQKKNAGDLPPQVGPTSPFPAIVLLSLTANPSGDKKMTLGVKNHDKMDN